MEIFKEIEGYPNYMISNYGNVYSFNCKRILKPYIGSNKKYVYVILSNYGIQKTKMIHRLVAQAFIKNPYNKPQVNHIDLDTTNNYYLNLEWCTPKENMIHARNT